MDWAWQCPEISLHIQKLQKNRERLPMWRLLMMTMHVR
jgi:hypothetical protein